MPASGPRPASAAPRKSSGFPPTRPTGSARTGRIPGGSPPSTSRSRPTSRSPRPSSSAAGSRRSTTSSSRSWPTSWASRSRWPGGSARRHSPRMPPTGRIRSTTSPTKDGVRRAPAELGRRGHRPEPGLLQPAPARQGQPRPGLFLPRPRRPAPRHGDPLPRGLPPAPLRDGRAQRLHPECRQLLGLRGAGDLLRDGHAQARRLARGRRAGRRADRGGREVASRPAEFMPARATSSDRTRTGSTVPTGSTSITSRPWP